jgi:hypothetical protein
MLQNGKLEGYLQIAFYDSNKKLKGVSNEKVEPFSYYEFPLNFFEPFKPINLDFSLPLVDN